MSFTGDLGNNTGGGSSGGPTQADFDALEVLVNTKQDSSQVGTAITSANLLQDASNMLLFASQADLNTKADDAATTTALAGKATQADLLALQGTVATKADDAATTNALAGKVDNAALTNVNANIANIISGSSELQELNVANLSYNSVGDNITNSYIYGRVDANSTNSAGWGVKNTNHAAGSSTLSFSSWDTSVSGGGSQGTPAAEVLSLNYNADTDKHLLFATGPLAVGSVPLSSTSAGELYCSTLKASSAVLTNLTIAGKTLPELDYYSQSGGESYLFGPSSSVAWTSGVTVTQQTGYQVLNITSFAQSPVISSVPVGVSARFSFELRRHSSTSLSQVTLHVNQATSYTGAVAGQFALSDDWVPHQIAFTTFASGMVATQIGNAIGGFPQTLGEIQIRNVAFQTTIGSSLLSQNLHVNGTASATSFTSTSDESIKTGASVASQDMCKAVLSQIDAKTYTRTDGVQGTRLGFIAQDVEAALAATDLAATNIVTRDARNPALLALSYDRMVCLLWQVVKNQEARIAALEDK